MKRQFVKKVKIGAKRAINYLSSIVIIVLVSNKEHNFFTLEIADEHFLTPANFCARFNKRKSCRKLPVGFNGVEIAGKRERFFFSRRRGDNNILFLSLSPLFQLSRSLISIFSPTVCNFKIKNIKINLRFVQDRHLCLAL